MKKKCTENKRLKGVRDITFEQLVCWFLAVCFAILGVASLVAVCMGCRQLVLTLVMCVVMAWCGVRCALEDSDSHPWMR